MSQSTEDLVNVIAASLAAWWRLRPETDFAVESIRSTELLWSAYEALEYLYPDEANE